MDITSKLDLFINDQMNGGMASSSGAITTGDIAQNLAKGHVPIVGGKCPKGQVYDKKKKVCVPSNNETSVVGGSYIDASTVNIIGSQQTRVWGVKKGMISRGGSRGSMIDLNRKEPVEDEKEDPTETNILGRKSLKFDKKTGAYTPELWEE